MTLNDNVTKEFKGYCHYISASATPKWETVSGISGSIYQFWNIMKSKITEARSNCTEQGGHLLRLETQPEYEHMKKILESMSKKLDLVMKDYFTLHRTKNTCPCMHESCLRSTRYCMRPLSRIQYRVTQT